ncbi:hypothetical protein F5884DRAFT_764151 [Xylogone sp. PMI_703]|nr:hypothetical protein F5884DRAFT_764151 [Xylogone sp. PMI_703]
MSNYDQSGLDDPDYIPNEWGAGGDHIMDSGSRPGTKRLFSNRGSIQDAEQAASSPYSGLVDMQALGDEETPPGKRPRVTDWPLSSTTTRSRSERVPLQSRTAPNSPSNRRARARSSRFLEGSMNDRVSKQPPIDYLGPQQEEDARERYEQEQQESYIRATRTINARVTPHYHTKSASNASTDSVESGRPGSSIFRFGKSLAASFNPTNWKIWSKQPQQQQPQPEQETAEQRILRERKERAEQAYQELKAAGHFRSTSILPGAHNRKEKTHSRSKNNSEDYGNGGMDIPMDDEQSGGGAFNQQPAYLYSSRARSTLSIRSPPGNGFDDSPHPSHQGEDFGRSVSGVQVTPGYNQRKLPSRKELEKQQKLVKRVSNLEAKLDLARRELARTMRQAQFSAQSSTPRFIPDGPITTPSERQPVNHYLGSDEPMSDDHQVSPEIGKALTTNQKASTHRSESVVSEPQDHDVMQSVETYMEDATFQQVTREQYEVTEMGNHEQNEDHLSDVEDHQNQRRSESKKRNGALKYTNGDQHTSQKQSSTSAPVATEVRKEQRGRLRKTTADISKAKREAKRIDASDPIEKDPNASANRHPVKLTKSKTPRKGAKKSTKGQQPQEEVLPGHNDDHQVEHMDIADEGIPPVPHIPTTVRLASGKVIRTSAESSRSARQKRSSTRNNEEFEWPEDVF